MKKVLVVLVLTFASVALLLPQAARAARQLIPRANWTTVFEGYTTDAFFDYDGNLWFTSRRAESPDTYYLNAFFNGKTVEGVATFVAPRVANNVGSATIMETARATYRVDRTGKPWLFTYNDHGNARLVGPDNRQAWTPAEGSYTFEGTSFRVIRDGDNAEDLPFMQIEDLYFDSQNNPWVIGVGTISTDSCTSDMLRRGCVNGQPWNVALIGRYDGTSWHYLSELDWRYPFNLLHWGVDPRNFPVGDSFSFSQEDDVGRFHVQTGVGTNKDVVLNFKTGAITFEEKPTSTKPYWTESEFSSHLALDDPNAQEESSAWMRDRRVHPEAMEDFLGLTLHDGARATDYELDGFEGFQANRILRGDGRTFYLESVDLRGESMFPPTRDFMDAWAPILFSTNTEAIVPGQVFYSPDYYGEYIRYTKIVKAELPAAAVPQRTGPPDALAKRLAGRILLQVEDRGKAWYVNPVDSKRYYLGTPLDAVAVMRSLGLGVSNATFAQFRNNTAPARLAGRILLKVEDRGRAYYVNPVDFKLHYLAPESAMDIMRGLGLGVSNVNLGKIQAAAQPVVPPAANGPDADADGVSDADERTFGTDELRVDTDRDGHTDGQEIRGRYNPLGLGAMISAVSDQHTGWNRYTAPAGYTIDFPDGYAPRVVDRLPGSGGTASIANFDAQYLAPRTADRLRILVSDGSQQAPSSTSIEQLRAQIQSAINAYPDLGVLADVTLGSAVRLSLSVRDSEGYSEMVYFACDDRRAACYSLSIADPGFTANRELAEQVVSTFSFH